MEFDPETVRLAAAMAGIEGRFEAAQRLAAHVGASTLLLLVEDSAVEAVLPAPGFPHTLPGGDRWREFLRRIRAPGVHRGELGYPAELPLRPAVAFSHGGLVLLFLDGEPGPSQMDSLVTLLPLLASTLKSEYTAVVAAGELRAAQDRARQSETLAHALDATRAEVERTLRALEQQTRELQDARKRAEASARAKDEFLAMLGHELRNPLSPIVTALQLMRLRNQSCREQDVIERQVASLMRLVDDLLDVSRITGGKIELRRVHVELAEIAARAIETSSPLLEKKRQTLAVDIAPVGLLLDADPSRLAQVLSNLLTNASKYSDPERHVRLSAERHGGRVRICVRDEGIGIPPAMLPGVFDLFVQQRQAIDRSEGGLGLGLAIVRSLVDMHGGSVTAHSEGEGRGSEFVVELPLASPADHRAPTEVAPAPHALPSAATARVLVVDDNEDAAGMLAAGLRSIGYSVRTALDGPSALRVDREFQPEIALLDIGLPVMDGYELAQRLRETSRTPRLRLIAITGYGQSEDRRRSAEAGFDAHLVKPVSLEDIEQVLHRLRSATPEA